MFIQGTVRFWQGVLFILSFKYLYWFLIQETNSLHPAHLSLVISTIAIVSITLTYGIISTIDYIQNHWKE